MGRANRMAIPTIHNEPRMAVRTPANSALDDMGVVRKTGVSHERNSSFASGYFSATSALISASMQNGIGHGPGLFCVNLNEAFQVPVCIDLTLERFSIGFSLFSFLYAPDERLALRIASNSCLFRSSSGFGGEFGRVILIFICHITECAIYDVVEQRGQAEQWRSPTRRRIAPARWMRCDSGWSRICERIRLRGTGHGLDSFIPLTKSVNNRLADQIQDQSNKEQHQRNGKETGVINRVVTQVAAADAGDMTGHGFSGLEWIKGEVWTRTCRDRHDHGLTDGTGDADDQCRANHRIMRPAKQPASWFQILLRPWHTHLHAENGALRLRHLRSWRRSTAGS